METGSLAINPHALDTPTLSTTPIYSLYIAGVYSVFGIDRYPLILIQILISVLTIFVVYKVAIEAWGYHVGLLAAGLMAIDPLQIVYSQIFLSETLFVFLIAISLLCATKMLLKIGRESLWWAFAFGFVIALATMTRPISHYLPIAVAFGLILCCMQLEYSLKHLALMVLLVLLPTVLITGAWQVRNGELTGVYELNNAKSQTMLYWKAKGVLMTKHGWSNDKAHSEIIRRLPKDFSSLEEKVRAQQRLANEIILDDMGSYLKLSAEGVRNILFGIGLTTQGKFYNGIDESANIGYKGWFIFVMAFSVVFMLGTYTSGAYGFYKAVKGCDRALVLHLLMLGFLFYFVIISSGHISAYSRMRLPVLPIILMYAAYGLITLVQSYQSRRTASIA